MSVSQRVLIAHRTFFLLGISPTSYVREHFNMTQSKKFKMTTHPPTNCHHVIKGVYEYTTYPPYSSLRHHRCFEITNKKKQLHFNLLNKTKKTSELFLSVGIDQITKQKKHLNFFFMLATKENIPLAKKNKGENKVFKKKQTKKRTFTHVFFQNESFFFNRNLAMATFFFVCSKHYSFVHTKKAFFALFFGFALLLEQKKNINKRSFFCSFVFFLFFVLFLKLVFVNPVSTQQPFLVSDLNFLVETKTA